MWIQKFPRVINLALLFETNSSRLSGRTLGYMRDEGVSPSMYNYNMHYLYTSGSNPMISLISFYACKRSHGKLHREASQALTIPLVLLSFLVVPADVGRRGAPEALPFHRHHYSPNHLHPPQMTTALCGTECCFQLTKHNMRDEMVLLLFFMNTRLFAGLHIL